MLAQIAKNDNGAQDFEQLRRLPQNETLNSATCGAV